MATIAAEMVSSPAFLTMNPNFQGNIPAEIVRSKKKMRLHLLPFRIGNNVHFMVFSHLTAASSKFSAKFQLQDFSKTNIPLKRSFPAADGRNPAPPGMYKTL